MKLTLVSIAAAAVLALPSAALAAPPTGPDLPTYPFSCQEINDLLGIDNVRECGDPDPGSRSAGAKVDPLETVQGCVDGAKQGLRNFLNGTPQPGTC